MCSIYKAVEGYETFNNEMFYYCRKLPRKLDLICDPLGKTICIGNRWGGVIRIVTMHHAWHNCLDNKLTYTKF